MNYRTEAPEIIKSFLFYHENVKGHSPATVDEYYLDLRLFFRYLKLLRGLVPETTPLEEISIADVDLDFVGTVTLSEVYDYSAFLSRDRIRNQHSRSTERGLSNASRARKMATIRSYYKYLTQRAKLLTVNPVQDLDMPKLQKSLPHYLTLEESRRLLEAVDGKNKERDYCILCIFLNCGLRVSELVGLNLEDIGRDHLRVLGKGNKERVVFLNDACTDAINDYLPIRRGITANTNAFLLSNRRQRISRETVHSMVKNTLLKAGIDREGISSHKLRHTAATLMLQNGVDVRTLQEILGHDHLNTTQIYTHVDSTELRLAADANPLAGFNRKNSKENQ